MAAYGVSFALVKQIVNRAHGLDKIPYWTLVKYGY